MENNIALNMREVADKVNEEAEKAKVALHEELVETKIIPYLQEFAEKGKYQVDFSVPGYSTHLVRDILREMGFTVEIHKFSHAYYLVVKW
jgi:hypothetical protein